MSKQIKFQHEAREALLRGMNAVADAVGATLGPRGQTVVLSRPFGPPLVTKDGVTVARDISLADRWENEGAKLIQEVAQRTNTEAGDGTTAATVLARALFAEGLRCISAGRDRRAIERGIQESVGVVVAELKCLARPVDKNDLRTLTAVATVAANGDTAFGDIIARSVQAIGLEGKVTLDQSPTPESSFEIAPGYQFRRGFISPIFMANPQRGKTIFDNCSVFVTDRRLIDDEQMQRFLSAYLQARGKAPLLIICEDCEGPALQMLALNSAKGVINVVPVRTPGAGAAKKEEIKDIAIFCGARPYMIETGEDPAKVMIEHLGYADRVIVTAEETTIVRGSGAAEEKRLRLDTRLDELRSRMQEPGLPDFSKAMLEHRIAALSAKIVVIRIGSAIHSKLLEKRDRVEDSVNATIAALREGIVPGGGTALIRCLPALRRFKSALHGDERIGAEIVARALTRPLTCIAQNAGVDPRAIVRCVEAFNSDPSPHPWIPDRICAWLWKRGYPVVSPMKPPHWASRWGYNAALDKYEDLVASGIVDPVKVVRLALQNASELAGLLLTTAALSVEFPDPVLQPQGPGVPVISRT